MKKKCLLIHSISRSSQVLSHTINVGFFALFWLFRIFHLTKSSHFERIFARIICTTCTQYPRCSGPNSIYNGNACNSLEFFVFFSHNKSVWSFLQFSQFLSGYFRFLAILHSFSQYWTLFLDINVHSKSIFQIITQLNCNFYLTVSIIHNSIYNKYNINANFSIIPPRFHWYYVF